MAREVEINYFSVVVNRQRETDAEDKAGNPKMEKWKDEWLVKAKTSEEANAITKKEYDGDMDEWQITSIKATKILGVLGEQ